ncbi:MAG TPA: restriction endonuclease [Methylophilaceae bacterium]|nr:restriction endonuclease [Methylophilaceae bacterium]
MARKRKKQSPIALFLEGSWVVPVLTALLLLIVFFIIVPSINNAFLSGINQSIQPFAFIVIIALIALTIYKLYQQARAAYLAKKYPLNQETESPFARTTMSEFVERPTNWSLKVIQDIEWKRFEDLSIGYYLEKGILAKATSLGADGGVDIKLYQNGQDDATSLVQCKSWNSKLVGVKEIREFLGVLTHEEVAKGFFMTSGDFTAEAKKTAKANKINLINGEMFLTMILRLPELSQQKLLALAVTGDYKTPTCSRCGIKMVEKDSKRGRFWGCSNFPKCRQRLVIIKA